MGKLEKLIITAYKTSDRKDIVGEPFTAMYNPTSISQQYAVDYSKKQAIGAAGKGLAYSSNKPAELSLKLILDGTGVDQMGIALLQKTKSVTERVNDFLNMAVHMNGDTHEPNYLVVSWGDLSFWGEKGFQCRLSSVDISYTSFDRDGTALRAELDILLLSQQDIEKRLIKEDKKSPDLTHVRLVKSGDTLPLLCQEVYGQASYYLRVAQANNLDNFRKLTPGQELLFPPLDKS